MKPPPLPTGFDLGPHHWTINPVPRLSEAADARGLTLRDRCLIQLDPDLEPTVLAEVLLHETLHACASGTMLDDDDEEAAIRIIAPNLLAVLRNNPDIAAFLLA